MIISKGGIVYLTKQMVDSKNKKLEITPEMIEVGVKMYDIWEPGHIFADFGAAEYAKEELVRSVFQGMLQEADPSPSDK